MITPDVNILVAAYLVGHPQGAGARSWLMQALAASASGAGFALLPMVAVGFVRVVTSARTAPVSPTADAFTFLKSILGVRGAWMPDLGPEWEIFEACCKKGALRGPIISDAWIAAAVRAHELHLVTFDADFRRLLPPDQFTLLVSENKVQEPRVTYLAQYMRDRQALAA